MLPTRSILSSRDRDLVLVRRPWTPAERKIVVQGLLGRLVIAIEPVICMLVFGALTACLIFLPLPASANMTRWEAAVVIAPIFGLATVAFALYAVCLLIAPVRAVMQTFSPIYIVDGYVRYRRRDRHSEIDSNGYVAVLNDERRMLAEWETLGRDPIPDLTRPALIEFTHFGGIHRIDGKSTGVLPERINLLGVGMNKAGRYRA
jgi:hypothetical protein